MGKSNNNKKTKGNYHPQQTKKAKKPEALVVNETNKYVLGGYFSLGLNNFYKTTMLVFLKAGIKVMSDNGNPIYSDEKIGEVLNTLYKSTLNPRPKFEDHEKSWLANFKLSSNQQVKLQKLVFHHFPILGPVMADEAAYKVNNNKKSSVTDTYSMAYGITLPECLKTLSIIAQGLVDCRNSDVHYYPYNSIEDLAKQYLVQQDIVRYLVKALVASRRLDKKRNNIETEKMEFLTGYTKDPKEDAGKALESYIQKWGFYPKYDQVVKTDEEGNVLYIQETDKDGKPKFDEDGNPIYKQKVDRRTKELIFDHGMPVYEPQVKMVERNDFFYKIGGETTIEKDDKVYSTLSGFGLAYFCSIFLTKPQAKQMLSDIGLFEKSPYPKELNDIIRDMLSIYRIRSPKGKKLEGSDTKITLALDILNELRKCPKDLYDVLSPKGQKFFEDEVKRPNERTPEVVKRFRSTDRFPYLAMRYIDETQILDNIRFQIQLGKLRFKFYSKPCINGEEEIRSLQKEINGFGRLQDIETKRQADYKKLLQETKEKSVKIEGEDMHLDLLQFEKDTVDSKPYITDSRAYYNVHSNRIGLFWNELTVPDKRSENTMRTIIKPGEYIPPLDDVKDGKALVTMPAPMAMLSIHELPALVFYDYLLKQIANTESTKTIESIIIEKYRNLRQFFTDVMSGEMSPMASKEELGKRLQAGYDLSTNDIPVKLRKYLAGESVDVNRHKQELIRDRLVKMLKRAIRRRDGFNEDRKKIGVKDNKYGKDSYVDVRHGSLSRYLSESFLEWQPSNESGNNKLTGMNFSKLQSELAVFSDSAKYNMIKGMLEKAGLLSGSFAHPFLSKLVEKNIRNIEELYLLYLNEEVVYLKSLLNIPDKKDKDISDNKIDFNKISLTPDVYNHLPFIKGNARWKERTPENIRQLAGRYLEWDGKRVSIWLPDGLFSKHILKILKTQFTDNKRLQDNLSKEDLTSSSSYLIRVFFEDQLRDNSQPFYVTTKTDGDELLITKFGHIYDLFNILNNKKERNAYIKVPKIVEEINDLFSINAEDENRKLIKRIGPDGKPLKDENDKILYKKLIHVEIDKRVNGMTYKERGNHKTLDEAKDSMRRKLTHMIGRVKENERTIRRYKAQDMVMFLMAERLMDESEAIGAVSKSEKFKLENVCRADFLNQTVNFEFPFKVGEDVVHITQEVMSLKNLGEFYQLLSDERLPSLLERLIEIRKKEHEEQKFGYSELMGELASYDIHRSRIFKAIHLLEKYIVSKSEFKQFLNDPDDERFYIKNDKTQDPKRNNFNSLLGLLEEGNIHTLSKDERELIISIRNAFSHNHYKVTLSDVAKISDLETTTLLNIEKENDSEDKKKGLTTIATLIAKKLEELAQKLGS